MNTSKRYTVTAALPYTNGPIHIGHLAGVYVPADIYARFLRLTGNDVAFICGSDEQHLSFLRLYMIKASLLKKPVSNFMMKKRTSFWQIVLL